MANGQLRRPRWATFSVIDHLDFAGLIDDVLLFDRLVLPTPPDEEGAQEEWEEREWEPDELAKRIVQLGDIAYPMPWTSDLRGQWEERFDRYRKLGLDSPLVALGLTPLVLSWNAVQDWEATEKQAGERSQFAPVVVATYQSPEPAYADFALEDFSGGERPGEREIDREVAALFRRELTLPLVSADLKTAEEAFHRAVALAHEPDFQTARRALFDWEDEVLAAGIRSEDAIEDLEVAVDGFEDLVKQHFKQTAKRKLFRAASIVGPALVGQLLEQPELGTAAGIGVNLIEGRFPSVAEIPASPEGYPEAALAIAQRKISVLYHDAAE